MAGQAAVAQRFAMIVVRQIPQIEYPQRLERLRLLMAEQGLRALLLGTGTNLRYFSGYPSPLKSGSRPFFLLLPLEGDPVLIVHSGRRAEAQRYSCISDVRDYTELSRIPVELIRDALAERGAIRGKLGMELGFEQSLDLPSLEVRRLEAGLPEALMVDASAILWRLRQVKSPAEIACLRRACTILSEGYGKAFAASHEGDTEIEIAGRIRSHVESQGADGHWTLATSGKGNYDLASKPPEARAVRSGDVVWFDAGCSVAGYWSDFSRGAAVGEPSAEQLCAQRAIQQITWGAVEMVRPGVAVAHLARACNRGLDRLGFAITSSISGLASRVGHGLGLDTTEPPHIAEYDPTILEPGMIITIEPGVATEYGTFHIEENVLVTSDGYEVLSMAPRELWRIPAEA